MGKNLITTKPSIQTTLLVIMIAASSVLSGAPKPRLDSLLNVLDQTINEEEQFNSSKQKQINYLSSQLNNKYLPNENKYHIYCDLYKAYNTYNFDSANVYIIKSAQLAQKMNKPMWIEESKIQLALINARSGMFADAIEILKSIDKSKFNDELLILYYNTFVETYIYHIEYLEGSPVEKLVLNRNAYRDSLLGNTPPDSYDYVVNYTIKCIEDQTHEQSEKMLFDYFSKLKPDTREYSVITSLIAYHYQSKGNTELQQEYLAMSAISDLKAAVKENNSLRLLAILLFEEGQLDRANRYIKQSLEDANFYHARLRNLQIAKVLPIIDKAYQTDREIHEQKLTRLLSLVSLLSVILMVVIYFAFKQMRKVSRARSEIMSINAKLNELNENLQRANDEQKRTNSSLAEANLIKEQYIGSFLELTTEYIDKFDSFKTMVNRKVLAGQKNDLLRLTADSEDSVRDLKKLYESFDKAFLTIYPDFVTELNKLLREDEQYPVTGKSLNQELRIFALIRLGITDSNKIATFLHYSLRTVYNYRSKVKSKAHHPDEKFEEHVKHICSLV